MQQNISNSQEFIAFLQKENKPYAQFILNLLQRDPASLQGLETNDHHIIPKHAGGPDEAWNLITLTAHEHITAHELLYQDYQSGFDQAAVVMLKGQFEKGRRLIWEENQRNMRKNERGFFNKELQRALASRPKKQRQPYARHDLIVAALEQGFDLHCEMTGDIIPIGPNECSSLFQVAEKILQHPRMAKELDSWNKAENKEKQYIITGLTRTLTGHIAADGKCVFSVKKWRVKGINIRKA
jgi:hypothetical protein